ncbi:MAG: DegV family protein, partial [Chloroflexi bacterium]|nr:DegV family protein [Chloroflexota bacterium]
MAVKVVTDSASDIPAELAGKLGISVVPCTVFFGAEAFKDGVEITKEEFFHRLTTGDVMPTTTQPSVGDFLDVYRPLAERNYEIVSVHVSGKLSGTVNSARLAAEELPNATVEIVDTDLASMGVALAAKAAVDAAAGGADAAGAAEAARNAAANTEVFVVPDTLEYLKRGGRIGGAQALLGSLLSMKPILKLKDGEVHPHEKVRTKGKAVQRMCDIAASGGPYREAAVM